MATLNFVFCALVLEEEVQRYHQLHTWSRSFRNISTPVTVVFLKYLFEDTQRSQPSSFNFDQLLAQFALLATVPRPVNRENVLYRHQERPYQRLVLELGYRSSIAGEKLGRYLAMPTVIVVTVKGALRALPMITTGSVIVTGNLVLIEKVSDLHLNELETALRRPQGRLCS